MSHSHTNLVAHVKKQAKKRSKLSPEKSLSHHREDVSIELGYRNYHDLLKSFQAVISETPTVHTLQEYLDKYESFFIKLLTDCISSRVPKSRREDKAQELWRLLFTEITQDSEFGKIEQLTRWEIYKEALKQQGDLLQEQEGDNEQAVGNICVSMGHYYRSLMDNCADQIGEHINFNDYFTLWLRSMYQDSGNIIANALMEKNLVSCDSPLTNRATSWAPLHWLKEKGRA